MTTLIEQIVGKLGLSDEPKVLNKTMELLRLLELRSTNVPLQLSEYAKTLLCADIAASLFGCTIDEEQALKISSLRKSHYAKHKRLIEKLLDLNKVVGVNDICVQLNLMEVSQKASELLELYKTVVTGEGADVDLIHPQYAAMAVFCASKLAKRKISKSKLLGFSNLRPTQWHQLELRWDRFLVDQYSAAIDKKWKKGAADVGAAPKSNAHQTCTQPGSAVKRFAAEVEDYEKWKKRMLLMAEQQLKREQQKTQLDKENCILGT